MTSFSKVIQPKSASFFKTPQPIQICSFNSLEDNEHIGAAIPMPGHFSTNQACLDARRIKYGFSMYIQELHASNALLLNKPTSPSNHEYNLANLMNLHFDAIRRRDFIAANRFQLLINNL